MTAQILEGKSLATTIKQNIKKEIQDGLSKGFRSPALAVILMGSDPASQLYVRNKQIACEEVGIISKTYLLDENTQQAALMNLIEELNADPIIDGILIQLPLPAHIDTDTLLERITPEKDVDGFQAYNLGRLAQRRPLLRPCTPFGIMLMLDSIGVDLKGKVATVVGTSNIVGLPMILELLAAGCTVTACHSLTRHLEDSVKTAELLIVAAGHPHLIKGDWIKNQAIVIDVGMNRLPNGNFLGDVEFDVAKNRASYITPVPGGVGPMTVACLLKNTLTAYGMQHAKSSHDSS